MKASKGTGVALFGAIVLFGLFSIIVFLAPLAHTVTFWLGYFFALFATVAVSVSLGVYFKKQVKEERFLALPAVKVAWTYFVLQMILSVWQIIAFPLPYLPTLILNAVLALVFTVLMLVLTAAGERIDKAEQYTAEKVFVIKQLRFQLDAIETTDAALQKKIKALAEEVRFSDPMSHSQLAEVESALTEVVCELADYVEDTERATELCDQAAKLLKRRNEQCRMLKGVKDPAAAVKTTGGTGLALTGVCVVLVLVLIVLSVIFVIVPQGQYDAAMKLLENKEYAAATAAFEALGGYRDSEEKIEDIAITLKDIEYEKAEELFDSGLYTEAMAIYQQLDGYRDSEARMVEIENRLSNGNVVYFGTYRNAPVAWRILKREEGRLLLLADQPITKLPMHDALEDVAFAGSSLKAWLNDEFVKDFSKEQTAKLITTDGMKVFLPDRQTVEALQKDKADLSAEGDWWIATESETGFMYVQAGGKVVTDGDLAVRDHGVRPAVWLSLD